MSSMYVEQLDKGNHSVEVAGIRAVLAKSGGRV